MRRATFHRFNKFTNDPLTFSSSWSRAKHALDNILHLLPLPLRNSESWLDRGQFVHREEGRKLNLFIILSNANINIEKGGGGKKFSLLNSIWKREGGGSRNVLEISSNQFEDNSLRTLEWKFGKVEVTGSPGNPTPLWKEIGNAGREVCDPRVIARQLCEKLSTPTWVFLSLFSTPFSSSFSLCLDGSYLWIRYSIRFHFSPPPVESDNFNYSYNINFSISFPLISTNLSRKKKPNST